MSIQSRKTRVLIVDDSAVVRSVLSQGLESDPDIEVVGTAPDPYIARDKIVELQPDVIVLDARLPGLSGTEILRRIAKSLPSTRVLVFSGYETPDLVREMLEAGAHGFVEKTAGLIEFKRGLETVARGGTYFGPAVASLLRTVVTSSGADASGSSLTVREREILQLVAESHSTKEIAAKLAISAKTVDNHRTNLMRKLNLHDVAGLTRYALEQGIVTAAASR